MFDGISVITKLIRRFGDLAYTKSPIPSPRKNLAGNPKIKPMTSQIETCTPTTWSR